VARRLSAVIVVEGLERDFGARKALQGLSFTVEPGEIFGFLGPNGAGKTTTIRILTGRLAATRGRVEVLGLEPRSQGPKLRAQLGVMGENPGHYERLPVETNLRFFARLARVPGERVPELLELVGLLGRRRDPVRQLSRGMRQRLALARALLSRPRLLFLDEPTAGLDPHAARDVRLLVEGFRANGGSVFLTTHYLEEAESLCQRVAILDQGQLLALDTPAGLCQTHLGQPLVPAQERASLAGVFLGLTGRSLEPPSENVG